MLDEGKKYQNICKQKFENKFICFICKKDFDLSTKQLHSNDCIEYCCQDCLNSTSLLQRGYKCNCGSHIEIDMEIALSFCKCCNKQTLLINFFPILDPMFGIVCKNCWLVDNLTNNNRLKNTNPNMSVIDLLYQDIIFCVACKQNYYKSYSNVFCPHGCSVCINHLNRSACTICGALMSESCIKW